MYCTRRLNYRIILDIVSYRTYVCTLFQKNRVDPGGMIVCDKVRRQPGSQTASPSFGKQFSIFSFAFSEEKNRKDNDLLKNISQHKFLKIRNDCTIPPRLKHMTKPVQGKCTTKPSMEKHEQQRNATSQHDASTSDTSALEFTWWYVDGPFTEATFHRGARSDTLHVVLSTVIYSNFRESRCLPFV